MFSVSFPACRPTNISSKTILNYYSQTRFYKTKIAQVNEFLSGKAKTVPGDYSNRIWKICFSKYNVDNLIGASTNVTTYFKKIKRFPEQRGCALRIPFCISKREFELHNRYPSRYLRNVLTWFHAVRCDFWYLIVDEKSLIFTVAGTMKKPRFPDETPPSGR